MDELVPLGVTVVGESEQLIVEEEVDKERLTVPSKPFEPATLMVELLEVPALANMDSGLADRVKS
jgi:hypothetical protein